VAKTRPPIPHIEEIPRAIRLTPSDFHPAKTRPRIWNSQFSPADPGHTVPAASKKPR